MGPIWQALGANLAVIAVLVIGWDLLSDAMDRLPGRFRGFALGSMGTAMGGGAVVSMALATPILPGFIFDLRAPLVAAAGFFGGPVAAAAAALTAIVFRTSVGGAGMMAGIFSVLTAAAVGLGFHRRSRAGPRTAADLVGFAAAVTVANLAAYLAAPGAVRFELIRLTALPVSTLVFVAAFVVALLLHWQARRRELARSNLIYRAMVEELPDALNAKDRDGRFLAVNPATAALMGADAPDDLLGRTDADFYMPELARQFRATDEAVLARGEAIRLEQEFQVGERAPAWTSTVKAPLHDASGRIIGIITHNRDISAEKKVQQFKDEFISTVSHELRTPLTSIRGALGLIGSGAMGALPEKAAALAKVAQTNSERLGLLINDILDVEKIESGKMTFDVASRPLAPILEEAVASGANYLPEKHVWIDLEDRAPGACAAVDEARLQQVMGNLISNAVKFSPDGGRVAVTLDRRTGGRLRISVADDGPGIPEAFRSRIFGKFEQADGSNSRMSGGTGLGLSIAKAIVERLGGAIGFDTAPGAGTVFHVDLAEVLAPPAFGEVPARRRAAAAAEAARDADWRVAARQGKRARVLHVEADESLRQVIGHALATEARVSAAASLREARAALAGAAFDLVILDPELPDGSGLDLLAALPEDAAVLVFSAAEFPRIPGRRPAAALTKTKASETQVARTARRLLAGRAAAASPAAPLSACG